MRRSLVITDSRVWNAETEYALSVARAEAEIGVTVEVAAAPGSPAAVRIADPIGLVELPGPAPSRSPADFLANVRTISEAVGRLAVDVVHSSSSTAHLVAALAAGSRARVVHLRGSAAEPSGRALNRYLYRRMTDAVVVSSSRVEDWVVERLGVRPDRVRRILAPVPDVFFNVGEGDDALRAELGLGAGVPIVLNVARLAPVKGHDVLLEAMRGVLEEVPDAVLMLVGEPWSGQPAALEARARELGMDRSVVFAGRREDVPRLLAASTVCVSSSIGSEENSRAVGEYMASGRPVVATRVGVIPELVIDGLTGVLVPPSDPEAMARGIRTVLTDRAIARRMGVEGKRVAEERFSLSAFRRGLLSVIEGVEGDR